MIFTNRIDQAFERSASRIRVAVTALIIARGADPDEANEILATFGDQLIPDSPAEMIAMVDQAIARHRSDY